MVEPTYYFDCVESENPLMAPVEIEISASMREAGTATLEQLKDSFPDYLLVAEIYKAMIRQRDFDADQGVTDASPESETAP